MAFEDWRPAADRSVIRRRAGLLADIRAFFQARNVLEVETPTLSQFGNTDRHIDSLQSAEPVSGDSGLHESALSHSGLWLRTSPEYPLKRLLAAGVGDCYELGRVYRAGERGRWHNPEFTLLEWYRIGWSYRRLMDEVSALVRAVGGEAVNGWAEQRLTYRALFQQYTGIDPLTADPVALTRAARRLGLDSDGLDSSDCLDLILSLHIQPRLPADTLTFVYDYPAAQAALAEISERDPRVARRFELYLGPVEVANGYQELRNADEQEQRFDADLKARNAAGRTCPPVDRALLAALAAGLPQCAGVALGVDRLLAVIIGAEHIDQVLAFPLPRA